MVFRFCFFKFMILAFYLHGYCHTVGGALAAFCTAAAFETPIETAAAAAAAAASDANGIMVEFVPA